MPKGLQADVVCAASALQLQRIQGVGQCFCGDYLGCQNCRLRETNHNVFGHNTCVSDVRDRVRGEDWGGVPSCRRDIWDRKR
jgi:hypothetical protein